MMLNRCFAVKRLQDVFQSLIERSALCVQISLKSIPRSSSVLIGPQMRTYGKADSSEVEIRMSIDFFSLKRVNLVNTGLVLTVWIRFYCFTPRETMASQSSAFKC